MKYQCVLSFRTAFSKPVPAQFQAFTREAAAATVDWYDANRTAAYVFLSFVDDSYVAAGDRALGRHIVSLLEAGTGRNERIKALTAFWLSTGCVVLRGFCVSDLPEFRNPSSYLNFSFEVDTFHVSKFLYTSLFRLLDETYGSPTLFWGVRDYNGDIVVKDARFMTSLV